MEYFLDETQISTTSLTSSGEFFHEPISDLTHNKNLTVDFRGSFSKNWRKIMLSDLQQCFQGSLSRVTELTLYFHATS